MFKQLYKHDIEMEKQDLVDLSIKSERMVSICGGTMDQTIITYGQADKVVFLDL